jgi:hypothetical protein
MADGEAAERWPEMFSGNEGLGGAQGELDTHPTSL